MQFKAHANTNEYNISYGTFNLIFVLERVSLADLRYGRQC